MTACASVNAPILPASVFVCRAPDTYPPEPDVNELVEALNDTYLAWEECSVALRQTGAALE